MFEESGIKEQKRWDQTNNILQEDEEDNDMVVMRCLKSLESRNKRSLAISAPYLST